MPFTLRDSLSECIVSVVSRGLYTDLQIGWLSIMGTIELLDHDEELMLGFSIIVLDDIC